MKKSVRNIFAAIIAGAALSSYAQNNGGSTQTAPAHNPAPAVTTPMQDVHPLALKDAPLPVQQSVRQRSVGAAVSEVDQANWNGQNVYSVVVNNHGKISQYVFDQNGKVLSEPGRTISEAAGAELDHSKQPTDPQHDHHILQQPK